MARKAEVGIDYFPLNADIVHNRKVKLVVAEFGPKAWAVLLPLYCKIYREKGYWIDWNDEDSKLMFAQDECKLELSVVNEIVRGFIRRFLFDKEVFDTFGILTSRRIQTNYLEATKRRKETELIDQFLVLKRGDVYKLNENVNIIDLKGNIIVKKDDIGTQSKVKEKEKESKGEEEAQAPGDFNEGIKGDSGKNEHPVIPLTPKKAKTVPGNGGEILNPFSADFKTKWEEWKTYKAKQHSFKFKHQQSEQAAINELFKMSGENEEKAELIIQQSMAKGWKGLFELKNEQNATSNSGTKQSNEPRGTVIPERRVYGRL